ncbi:MAG: DNA topoisomerase III [Clostridia bacterium]|nr:DNA topoisomerase III [Clostridia bacterium]
MGKILVLAEKPSVGRELARVLGANAGRDGFMEGSRYVVTWALGHLVTLADPEHYGAQYKKWDLETLPMLPEKMALTVIKSTSKQFGVVKTQMLRNDIDSIVIATDAGREGELVARWIIAKTGCKKPLHRLWISSQTDKAIKEGFANLKPGSDYVSLYQSAQCRAEADWLIGLNISRALTCRFNAQLNAGRVQTPTLAMIVAREEEIAKFRPEPYELLSVVTKDFTLQWRDKSGHTRIFDPEKANDLEKKSTGAKAKITAVKREKKREQPPLLYDLTELQRDANKKYAMSAKQTLDAMQTLYERHKVLTYPRTDSKYISDDIVPTLPERLKSLPRMYAPLANEVTKRGIKPTKRFVDNSKVSDHHAIIPTEQYVDVDQFSTEERRIYDLVVRRFLAALSPDFEYEQMTITADVAGEIFTAKGKTVQNAGWKAGYGIIEDEDEPSDETEQTLPTVNEGDMYSVLSVKRKQKKTTPPARYTEATLLGAMEHPGKFLSDSQMREAVEEAGGLGTPATRADIIEKLFNTAYIEKHGRELIPTSKGKQLISLAPKDLTSPLLTAKWEERLSQIAKGKADGKTFIKEMRTYATQLVSDVVKSEQSYRHDNMTGTRCPNCGKFMLEVNGKKGKKLVCQDRECGYRENLSFLSNARCPNCHKRLNIFGEGEKKTYICPCGFKEKFDRFNARMKEERDSMGKREMAAFMREQEKEKSVGTSLSDALSKLKLK